MQFKTMRCRLKRDGQKRLETEAITFGDGHMDGRIKQFHSFCSLFYVLYILMKLPFYAATVVPALITYKIGKIFFSPYLSMIFLCISAH